jgi:hypothetical protein
MLCPTTSQDMVLSKSPESRTAEKPSWTLQAACFLSLVSIPAHILIGVKLRIHPLNPYPNPYIRRSVQSGIADLCARVCFNHVPIYMLLSGKRLPLGLRDDPCKTCTDQDWIDSAAVSPMGP